MKILRTIQHIGVHDGLEAGLARRILLLNTMSLVIMLCIFPYIFVFWTLEPFVSLLSVGAELSYLLILWLNHRGWLTASRQLFLATQTLIIGVFAQLFGPGVGLEDVLFACAIYPVLMFELGQRRQMIPGLLWPIGCFYALAATAHAPLPGLPRVALEPSVERLFFYSFNGIAFLLLLSGVMYLSALYARAEREREATIKALVEANAARDRADEASEAKSRFLANMSHELRTPLNAIIGYAGLIEETLEDGVEEPELLRADVRRVGDAGRHLLRIVSDILDLSKIEASEVGVVWEPVSVRGVVEEVGEQAALLVAERGNRWSVEIDPALDIITTDSVRLKQILLNLISNAAKFTTEGDISLTASLDGDNVVMVVRDTGIGVEPAQQERIFEPFVQADDSFTRTHQGTGLGLTLSRRFAHLLGGSLTLESQPGAGSAFELRLPVGGARSANSSR